MSTFRENLYIALKKSGITKAELGRLTGISTSTIQQWDKKNSIPKADAAVKIAKELGTTVEALVTGETSFDPAEMYIRKNPSLRSIVIKLGLHPELIEHFLGYIAGYMTKHGYSDEEETEIAQSTG